MKSKLYDPIPWMGHPERESKRVQPRLYPQHPCDLLGGQTTRKAKPCARRPH